MEQTSSLFVNFHEYYQQCTKMNTILQISQKQHPKSYQSNLIRSLKINPQKYNLRLQEIEGKAQLPKLKQQNDSVITQTQRISRSLGQPQFRVDQLNKKNTVTRKAIQQRPGNLAQCRAALADCRKIEQRQPLDRSQQFHFIAPEESYQLSGEHNHLFQKIIGTKIKEKKQLNQMKEKKEKKRKELSVPSSEKSFDSPFALKYIDCSEGITKFLSTLRRLKEKSIRVQTEPKKKFMHTQRMASVGSHEVSKYNKPIISQEAIFQPYQQSSQGLRKNPEFAQTHRNRLHMGKAIYKNKETGCKGTPVKLPSALFAIQRWVTQDNQSQLQKYMVNSLPL